MALIIPKIPLKYIPIRMYISIICCFGVIMSYMLRFCISLCILKMVKAPQEARFASDNSNTSTNITHYANQEPGSPEFDWNEKEQGYVLSALFFTYFLFQIPTGYFADKAGSLPLVIGGMSLTSFVSLLTPEVARLTGWIGLVIFRLFMGAGQALAFIPLHSMLNEWVPLKERSTYGALIFSGAHLGSCLNMFITGQLLNVWEWPMVFRLYGIFGLLWTILFMFSCYSYPDQCKYLSDKEKRILEEAGLMERKKRTWPPWLKIFSNPPVWMATWSSFAHDWVLFTLVADLPKILKSVLGISLTTNSLINGVMYVLIWLVAVASGPLIDFINRKELMSLAWNRKLFVSLCSVPPALGLVWFVHTNGDVVMAIAVLLVGCSFVGFFYSSLKLNGLDLSPHYAGTVSSIINALASSAGFIALNITGQLTPTQSIGEWRIVMYLALAIMVVTNVTYVIWGSALVQPFDNPKAAKEAEEEKMRKKEEKQRKKEEKRNKKDEKNLEKEGKPTAETDHKKEEPIKSQTTELA